MGKFNAGQKLNAIFVAGCIPVMLATGGIMRWFDPFPLAWRTGATFVHDWTTLAARRRGRRPHRQGPGRAGRPAAMRTGTVPHAHVQRRHPAGAAEIERIVARPPASRPPERSP